MLDSSLPPRFIVIGAQKCGTTTLYEDLRQHPDVYIPDKESSGLTDHDVLTESGARAYRALFAGAPEGSMAGEVSTTYAMLPMHPEVLERSRALQPETRIIYIVRDPIDRAISHHHHDFALGLCGPDIDQEVYRHPEIVDNTRYATQLGPWVERFGRERVLAVRFEDYVSDRATGIARVQNFLGLRAQPLASDAIHNSSEGRRVAVGAWARVSQSEAYRRLVRPLMSERVRRRIMSSVLPAAPDRPDPPSEETLAYLASELGPEVDSLASLIGQPPWWDVEASVRRHLARP